MAMAPRTPAAAARVVVRAMSATWGLAATVEAAGTPGGGGRVGGGAVAGALGAGRHRGAGVEAVPADPEDQDAEHRERHVVTRDRDRPAFIIVLAETGAEEKRARQGRHRAREVNDG